VQPPHIIVEESLVLGIYRHERRPCGDEGVIERKTGNCKGLREPFLIRVPVTKRCLADFSGFPPNRLAMLAKSGHAGRGGQINFERGVVTIELPPPYAEEEARVLIDEGGRRSELPREKSWAFRRQAEAFVSAIMGRARPLALGEDSVIDIALAEAIWMRSLDASRR
jgi:hypothetical protein